MSSERLWASLSLFQTSHLIRSLSLRHPRPPIFKLSSNILTVSMNEWDLDKIASVFSDSLEHHILPKTLERPVLSKYLTYSESVLPLFKSFQVQLYQVVEAENIITLHPRGQSMVKSVTGAPYKSEYMMIMHFTPPKEGSTGLLKISLVKGFVDSNAVLKIFKEGKAKAAAGSQATGRVRPGKP